MSRQISITIDVNSRKPTKYQDLVKKYDALSLSITCMNGITAYDFTGKTVKVFLKKADNTKIEQAATINGNIVSVATLSVQSSTAVGQVEGEVVISDGTGIVSSSTFLYEVEGSISTEILVESKDDVLILNDLQAKIDNYNSQVASVQADIPILTQKIADSTTAKNNLQTVINNANSFATTYADIANAQVNIVNLNYVKDAAAELTRETIPSGFTQLSDLDYTYMSTNPNTIKLSSDSVAFVNGYKTKIPAGTVITLNAPPTSGTRDDLVFLECWKQTDASGAITWNSRIRVVDGVNFNYTEGINDGADVKAQGSNTTPTNYTFYTSTADKGLYLSGGGASYDKTALGTTDGYVYAIQMFRVHRRNSGGYGVGNGNGSVLKANGTSTRPDKLYADIIVERDITGDLRHQVSLTGFNYQSLLEENFDKLLRGELQTNAKTTMLKTYHGISKTPIDANTVFYASFDGTVVAEVGGTPTTNFGSSYGYKSMPTGLGYYNYGGTVASLVYPMNFSLNSSTGFTIDMFQNFNSIIYSADILRMGDCRFIVMQTDYMWFSLGDNNFTGIPTSILKGIHHIRAKAVSGILYLYLDGKLYKQVSLNTPISISAGTSIVVFNCNSNGVVISDLSISNIDRGSAFLTLPQDFIDGYARISPAFNTQRKTFSDALTSETITDTVKATGETKKQLTITQATSGTWTSGDKVKVKGLGGEIITGVIDSDTVIAKSLIPITASSNSQTLKLDSVNGIAVGDTFGIVVDGNLVPTIQLVVDSIDTVNTNITIHFSDGGSHTASFNNSYCLIESTASSSSPTVKYYNGTALADVSGTWSGLGTNESTFTLGTNANLTNQELIITYSLNEIAGQGGISEVLTATLAGESNGKKLVANPSIHVRDDFGGKISGSVVENPNIYKVDYKTSLSIPSAAGWYERQTAQYLSMSTINNTSDSVSSAVNGNIAQQLFTFNIIRILEDKFGPLPCGSDIVSKVAYAKANINKIVFNWWGYGSCPGGNKAYVTFWNSTSWFSTPSTITSNSPSMTYVSLVSYISNAIDANGFIHFLAYTDSSNGTTASSVFTDYCNIEITLNTPVGYDVLAPENPRRDDGKGNMLLVQKETKTISTMFPRSNVDGVVTYGDCVPSQLVSLPNYGVSNLYLARPLFRFITTAGTGGISKYFNLEPTVNLVSSCATRLTQKPLYNLINEPVLDDDGIDSYYDGSPSVKLLNTHYRRGYIGSNMVCRGLLKIMNHLSCEYSIIRLLDGSVVLYLITSITNSATNETNGAEYFMVYLKNRPLIK